MGLLDPILPTQIQQLQGVQSVIVQNNITAFQTLKNVIMSNWTLIWNNPQGLTPQQVLDQFGTDAGSLFSTAIATITLLETLQPGCLDPMYLSAALPYIINLDNTVSVVSKSVVSKLLLSPDQPAIKTR